MLPAFLLRLAPAFVPERFRKAFGAGVAIIGLLALLFIGWQLVKRNIIATHEAKQGEKVAKADRKADAKAAEQRRVDDRRSLDEAQEVKEAINEAKAAGRDPRAAYYECVRLQQSARAKHQPSPDC